MHFHTDFVLGSLPEIKLTILVAWRPNFTACRICKSALDKKTFVDVRLSVTHADCRDADLKRGSCFTERLEWTNDSSTDMK